jgi:hypothetical protein
VKAWYLYIILTFQSLPGPLAPVEQKTIILGFDHGKECISIAEQVDKQVQAAPNTPFRLKVITCLTCKELYGAKCPLTFK